MIAALSIVVMTGFTSDTKVSESLTLKATSTPKELNSEDSNKVVKEVFGESSVQSFTAKEPRLKLDYEISKTQDIPNKVTINGKGQLKIDNSVYNFEVVDSNLNKVFLPEDSITYYYGPIETKIKNKNQDDVNVTLSLNYCPELNQKLVYISLGTIEEPTTLSFGEMNLSDEITKKLNQEIIINMGGGHGEQANK